MPALAVQMLRGWVARGEPGAAPPDAHCGPSAAQAGRVFGCRRRIERDGSSGAGGTSAKPGGLNGTGLRVPEAPRQSRGRFAARGPVPLARVFASRPEDPSRSLSPAEPDLPRAVSSGGTQAGFRRWWGLEKMRG